MAGTEIFDISGLNSAGYGPIRVYVNVGYEPYPSNFNPLPDSKFDSYLPDPGFVLNTGLRTPLFSGAFKSSPLLDDGEYDYITDSQGYTWLYNTFNYMAIEPFRREDYSAGLTRYSAALAGPPLPGDLQLVVNDKNQPQTFASKDEQGAAIEYYIAADKNGNEFILGSVDSAYADDPGLAFERAELPVGWVKRTKTFEQDLTIEPAFGDGNRRIYNQFRDNITNNYFQFVFAKNGKGLVRGVPGLALSGGNGSDRVTGTSLNETIYGAEGDDRLFGFAGRDQMWGDAGDDLIRPGTGKNRLWGGAGEDRFVVSKGRNIIEDFSLRDGDNLILGSPMYSLTDTDRGVDVVGARGSALVLGLTKAELVSGDHLIV
jgi:Ca2+-binding RTX toxin-like protein